MRVCTLSVAGMAQSLDLSSRGPGTWNLAKDRNEGVRNPADLTESRKPFLTEDLHSWSRSSWGCLSATRKRMGDAEDGSSLVSALRTPVDLDMYSDPIILIGLPLDFVGVL